MATYVIAEATVTDSRPRWRSIASWCPRHSPRSAVAFIVRGGAHQTVEGDSKPNRLVILEFPSMEQARRWYDSEEYREPKAMRLRAGRTSLVMVEGDQPRVVLIHAVPRDSLPERWRAASTESRDWLDSIPTFRTGLPSFRRSDLNLSEWLASGGCLVVTLEQQGCDWIRSLQREDRARPVPGDGM